MRTIKAKFFMNLMRTAKFSYTADVLRSELIGLLGICFPQLVVICIDQCFVLSLDQSVNSSFDVHFVFPSIGTNLTS